MVTHQTHTHQQSRDSSQSGTEEQPPPFIHKTAPVKQERGLDVPVAISCNVGPFLSSRGPVTQPERKRNASYRTVLKYIGDAVTWYMLLSSALVGLDESQLLVIKS